MIKLFKFNNYEVSIDPEALMLVPIRKVWDKDKSKDKQTAMRDLAYIYFMYDPRSDYQYIVDDDARHEAILEGEGMPKGWKKYKELEDAIAFYNKFKSTAILLLEDTRFAVDKLRKMLRDIDLNATDANGKPIYTLSSITQTIKQVPALVRDLDEAEKSINNELQKVAKARGNASKSLLDDGEFL